MTAGKFLCSFSGSVRNLNADSPAFQTSHTCLTKIDNLKIYSFAHDVAASGGYMIASQAHQLIAAPFATVGSIGVIMEGLNFHEIARKYGIQPIVIKAGTNKNPLSSKYSW